MRTGFLAFVEHTGVTGSRSDGLDEGLRMFTRAEELGYDAGWVRVRHLEPFLSAPLPFLTAAGQRTERISLGTSIIPMRYEQPVRLAEEAATTDLLVGGRLHLGLSAGYAHGEGLFSEVFGRPGLVDGAERTFDDEVDHRLRRFLDAVRGGVLTHADATTGLIGQGTEIAPEGTPLTAQPLSPGLANRLSYGAGRRKTAVRTGSLGLGLQLSTLNGEVTDLSFEQYQAAQIADYREAHRAAAGTDGYAGVGRMILPLLTDADRDDFAYLIERSDKRQALYGTPDQPPVHFGVVLAGSPDEITAALNADAGVQAADELTIVLPFGHAPAVSYRMLETVSKEILPGLI